MRHVAAAFAWIEREMPAGRLVLTQWNSKWQAFNLVGGKVEPGESFRDCVIREISEELGLSCDVIAVENDPVAEIELAAQSTPAQQITEYQMSAFRVTIDSTVAWTMIEKDALNRLLTPHELLRSIASDGKAVSEVATRFARILLAHWSD